MARKNRTRSEPTRDTEHDSTEHALRQAKFQDFVDGFPGMTQHRRAAVWTYLLITHLLNDSLEVVERQKRAARRGHGL